jgi:hypothetical protein
MLVRSTYAFSVQYNLAVAWHHDMAVRGTYQQTTELAAPPVEEEVAKKGYET